jgi:hypothetical protein
MLLSQIFVSLLPVWLAASSRPELIPARNLLASGEELSATLSGPLPSGAVVPSCHPLRVERFNEEAQRWQLVPDLECTGSEPAVPLGPEMQLVTRVHLDRFGIVRLVLVYGLGCREGLSLEKAGCASIEAISSTNLSVQVPTK